MPTSKVTRKGQVTIPQEIRATLGIREGDTVQIVRENDRVIVRRVALWAELAGSLGHAAHLVPDDETELKELIEAAWASEAAERLGGTEGSAGERRPAGANRPGGEEPR